MNGRMNINPEGSASFPFVPGSWLIRFFNGRCRIFFGIFPGGILTNVGTTVTLLFFTCGHGFRYFGLIDELFPTKIGWFIPIWSELCVLEMFMHSIALKETGNSTCWKCKA